MSRHLLRTLYQSSAVERDNRCFDEERLRELPEPVRRYLRHAIAPDAPLAEAVRLRMRGEIRLREWLPFRAEQVVNARRGFVWRAAVRRGPVVVRGADSLVDGVGRMRWKIFGLIPVMTADGRDVTRSNVGRFLGESLWLPSMLLSEEAAWTAVDDEQIAVDLEAFGVSTRLTLRLDASGRALEASFPRWGDASGVGTFGEATFGLHADEEATFGAFTVPTRIRAGWQFGSDAFAEGEFFRATVECAEYR